MSRLILAFLLTVFSLSPVHATLPPDPLEEQKLWQMCCAQDYPEEQEDILNGFKTGVHNLLCLQEVPTEQLILQTVQQGLNCHKNAFFYYTQATIWFDAMRSAFDDEETKNAAQSLETCLDIASHFLEEGCNFLENGCSSQHSDQMNSETLSKFLEKTASYIPTIGIIFKITRDRLITLQEDPQYEQHRTPPGEIIPFEYFLHAFQIKPQ